MKRTTRNGDVPSPEAQCPEKKRGTRASAKATTLSRKRIVALQKQTGQSEARLQWLHQAALERKMLFGDYTLYTETNTPLTVADILRSPEVWHGKRFIDPLAAGFKVGKGLVYADLSGQADPRLLGKEGNALEYALRSELAEIWIIPGDQARVVDEIVGIIQLTDDFYRRGGELVRIVDRDIRVVNALWLTDYLSRCIRFLRPTRGGMRQTDIARRFCDLVLVKIWELDVPPLRGVMTAPTMRRDGTVVQKPGYDAQTALYLVLMAVHEYAT